MGNRAIPLGEHGKISFAIIHTDEQGKKTQLKEMPRSRKGITWRARTRVHRLDGYKVVEASHVNKTDAEALVKESAKALAVTSKRRRITSTSTLQELAELWLLENDKRSNIRQSTRDLYTYNTRYLTKIYGGLKLAQLDVEVCTEILEGVMEAHTWAVAKTVRSCLSGMLKTAIAQKAVPQNYVRDVVSLERPEDEEREPRAFTIEEEEQLFWAMENVAEVRDYAHSRDMPDLIHFLLGTGVRLGEAAGLRWKNVNLETGTVRIEETAYRLKGESLGFHSTKSKSGKRVLQLPDDVVEMLKHRYTGKQNKWLTVFKSPMGGIIDVSNESGHFRKLFDNNALDFTWASSHTCRRTVATRMDEQGFTAREIADQLGHSKISMTLDVYMGRKVANERSREALARRTRPAPRAPHAEQVQRHSS